MTTPRRWSFGLRTMMVLVAIAAVACAQWPLYYREQIIGLPYWPLAEVSIAFSPLRMMAILGAEAIAALVVLSTVRKLRSDRPAGEKPATRP